jgi:hypothetical protein
LHSRPHTAPPPETREHLRKSELEQCQAKTRATHMACLIYSTMSACLTNLNRSNPNGCDPRVPSQIASRCTKPDFAPIFQGGRPPSAPGEGCSLTYLLNSHGEYPRPPPCPNGRLHAREQTTYSFHAHLSASSALFSTFQSDIRHLVPFFAVK